MIGPTLVEFLGTSLLVGGGAFGGALFAIAGLAIAISLGGRISGGHFNPAVTFFKYLNGDITQTKALYYVSAQYCASILIFFLYNL
jgi:glycerol uptake facilitator-like aquaporin